MDKQDKIDFQLAKYEEDHAKEIKQMWRRHHKFGFNVLIIFSFMLLFLVLFT